MMGILEDLAPKRNQIAELRAWLEAKPKKEREEWLEALRRGDIYSTKSILALIQKHGLDIKENAVARFRLQMEDYVSAR
jgi:hypothetical protein